MRIILDSNEYIFGIGEPDLRPDCARVIDAVRALLRDRADFRLILPEMVREEVQRNLAAEDLGDFYRLLTSSDRIERSYIDAVPPTLFQKYRDLGLKFGDATIAAFAEQEQVEVLISENRDIYEELKVEIFLRCTAQQFLDWLDSGEIWTRIEQLRSSRSA